MNAEARQWMAYAGENLEVARMSLERGLLNPCLQNAQQAVEKTLKALLVARGGELSRTHSIRHLARQVAAVGLPVNLSDEECDLLDAIYIPSKYPAFGVLPGDVADSETCQRCILIAERIFSSART